jgi:hypothetical protein
MTQKGLDELGIVRPLFLGVLLRKCAVRKGALYPLADCKPIAATNLLDEPLKGFIVNSADLPW